MLFSYRRKTLIKLQQTKEIHYKTYQDFIMEANELIEKGYSINATLYAKAKLKEQEKRTVEEGIEEIQYPLKTK